MELMRIKLMALSMPDLHTAITLSGIHYYRKDERKTSNLLLTIWIASSMGLNGSSPLHVLGWVRVKYMKIPVFFHRLI